MGMYLPKKRLQVGIHLNHGNVVVVCLKLHIYNILCEQKVNDQVKL